MGAGDLALETWAEVRAAAAFLVDQGMDAIAESEGRVCAPWLEG